MKSALAILGETGRTDFTVLEVVERSKTSLRSFYQHFSTKDELLLALIDKIMSESTRKWREDTDRPARRRGAAGADRPHLHARRIDHPGQGQPRPDLLQRPPGRDAAPRVRPRALPLHELIKDIINRGIADGSFRAGLDVDATAALIMQIGARRDAAAASWAPN